jgi:hypothetical protein
MWQGADADATGVSRVTVKMRLGVSPVPRHSASACLRVGVHDDRARGEDLCGSQRATPSKGSGTAGDDTLCRGTLVPTVRATTTLGAMQTVGRNARQCEHFPAAHDRVTLAEASVRKLQQARRIVGAVHAVAARRTAHAVRRALHVAAHRARPRGRRVAIDESARGGREARPDHALRARMDPCDLRPTADRSVLRTSGRDWSEIRVRDTYRSSSAAARGRVHRSSSTRARGRVGQ